MKNKKISNIFGYISSFLLGFSITMITIFIIGGFLGWIVGLLLALAILFIKWEIILRLENGKKRRK